MFLIGMQMGWRRRRNLMLLVGLLLMHGVPLTLLLLLLLLLLLMLLVLMLFMLLLFMLLLMQLMLLLLLGVPPIQPQKPNKKFNLENYWKEHVHNLERY
jgi:hypothetical protein